MYTHYRMAGLAAALGLLLVIAPGCGTKAIQTTSDSSTEQGVSKAQAEPGVSEQDHLGKSSSALGQGRQSQDIAEPRISEQDLLGKSPSAPGQGRQSNEQGEIAMGGGGKSPSAPGQGRQSEDIMVAKVEPSDAARRHAEEIQREQVATAIAGLKDIFFTFDSWNISDEAKQALEMDAQWLQSNPEKMVMVEGHCDERGTQAYNLVLGEKRAKAVRNYLVELGVGISRLTVTSYGKERPFCKEHEEACYQQNRRGHMTFRVR